MARESVTIIPAEGEIPYDADQDAAFDEFRDKLKQSNQQGTLRVYRVPIDERGQILATAKWQGELFACPIDLYSFEEVIAKIRREFIRPGQVSMAARLLGTRAERSGPIFNKIIIVERTNEGQPETSKESVAEILRVIQDANTRQQEFMQRFFEKLAENRAPVESPMKIALEMIGAMGGFMGSLNKNAPVALPAGPAGSLKEMVETMIALRELASDLGGGGKNEDENTPVGIARAVAPLLQPIANALADKSRAQTVVQMRRALPSPQRPNAAPLQGANPAKPSTENVAPLQGATPSHGALGATPAHGTNPMTEETNMLEQIRPQLDSLCELAEQNADPKEVAGLVMDLVPENFDETLWRVVSSKRFVTNLGLLNPKVKQHREFFEKVREAIIQEFSEENGGSVADIPTVNVPAE